MAENTTDGVVAPLFYAALAGPVGLWVYKAINTLDSMVGYRNERYLRFGWASARADDVANFLPARLTWLLLSLAALLTGQRGRHGLAHRLARRPQAPEPERRLGRGRHGRRPGRAARRAEHATAASLLAKPHLGEPAEPLTEIKVRQAIRVMFVASWLALAAAFMLRLLLWLATY